MIDWEELLFSDNPDEVKKAKIWLFRENMRLEQEQKALEEAKEKFNKERASFKEEMNALNRRSAMERQRLKEENLFFDKKMQILQDGFRQLELDRKAFDAEKERVRKQQAQAANDYYSDGAATIVGILFRNATNPLTLRKRYKDLIKIFHPDNIAGDEELVQLINREFSKRKREEA